MAFKVLQPLGKQVLVKLEPVVEKTVEGGKIIVPRSHAEITRVGVVLQVGHDVARPIKPGDKFLCLFHAGTVIDWAFEYASKDDTERLLDEYEILAIVDY